MVGRPRDLLGEQFWRRHIRQHHDSGLSVPRYCRDHELHQSAFYSWRRRLAIRDRGAAAAALKPLPTPAFLPVTVLDPTACQATTAIEIILADGSRVRARAGCDRQLLADVLALLARGARGDEVRPC